MRWISSMRGELARSSSGLGGLAGDLHGVILVEDLLLLVADCVGLDLPLGWD